MIGKRKRVSIRERRALTLSSFERTIAKVEAEAAIGNGLFPDRTLQGVVILARAFADKLRDDAAIS